MLTYDDFENMTTQETLEVIAAFALLNNLNQIQPEEYRDTMVNAAERLNTIRNQKWSEWAGAKGLL